ncbi:molybdenum-pterin-binding protein [Heliobacterium gestii]|uniref:Molybdenum-pterin-binding protein n=1 Tax=Heliomicrobium gestii TaxID=2699 RepID=A0A845LBD5_HELGE|nr:TOBE domain-containing protein [Heliomicrobium gestii]MBM7865575.1 molybdopterin-binding protein [Heliomicrobium gestii]MZP41825.1 molybdenum-pterin-binding protein [Heliomicrobium gestii]
MKLTARNQLKGTVIEIKEGQVMAEVVLDIGGGNQVTSMISRDALNELELKVGSEAAAIIKSTSVMLMA